MTTVQLSDELMQQAMQSGDAGSPQETVEEALRLLIRLRKQGDAIRGLRGSAIWEGDLEESRTSRFAG